MVRIARKTLKKKHTLTVRVPLETVAMLGNGRSVELEHFLDVFGNQLNRAGAELCVAFAPEEWRVLAVALEPYLRPLRLSACDPDPARGLSYLVEAGLAAAGLTEDSARLVERVRELGPTHAWALLYGVDFWHTHRHLLPAGCEWWRFAARRQFFASAESGYGFAVKAS